MKTTRGISFDANDYRLLRIEELRMSAGAAAEKVKQYRRAVPLQPHEQPRTARGASGACAMKPTLRSESSGQGGFRHVVIYPAGMASLPDPPAPPPMRRPSGPPRGGGRDDRGGNRGDRRDKRRPPHRDRSR